MAYSQTSDLVNEYGAVNILAWADLEATGNAITDPTIAARIAYQIGVADSIIDAHLRAGKFGFILPLSPVPPIITAISAIIAGYRLYMPDGVRDYDERGKAVDILSAVYQEHLDLLSKIAHAELDFGFAT